MSSAEDRLRRREVDPDPSPAFLSNGRYRVLLTATGHGYSVLDRTALTVWRNDPVEDACGWSFWLREPESGRIACLARCRAGEPARARRAVWRPGRASLHQGMLGLETTLDVAVIPGEDAEIRRLVLHNPGDQDRCIEITSFVEIALAEPDAHAAHPVFSKIFLETDWDASRRALLARRRPRASGDASPWLAHSVLDAEVLGFETDRARFLGRGEVSGMPRGIRTGERLSGTVGGVLDPVFALRCRVEVAAGETREVSFALGAGTSRDGALALMERLRRVPPVEWLGAAALPGAIPPPVVIRGDPGTTTAQGAWPPLAREAPPTPDPAGGDPGSDLEFFNGFGGFSPDGGEYGIHLAVEDGRLRLPPRPWINVVANERFGFLLSETGAGSTWSGNSRTFRITPWHNDPVLDPHGEAWYLRDEDAGAFWSAFPGPAPGASSYEMRHGLGYSRCRFTCRELEHETVAFVPREDSLKIVRIRLVNRSPRPRRITLFSYCRPVLGDDPDRTARWLVTGHDEASGALFARNPHAAGGEDTIVFAALAGSGPVVHVSGDRRAFLGAGGDPAVPEVLARGWSLDGRTGPGLDPCLALQSGIEIPPHASVEISHLLGVAGDPDSMRRLLERYREPGAVESSLSRVRDFWDHGVSGLRISTPSRALDLMVNRWLPYQTLSCRLWARSAFYQSGGAFGFRDQLQDAAALLPLWPERTRAQLLLHAAHQFEEGDVLHWWHPPDSRGMRTRFADDLLWLPFLTATYVRWTGDDAILTEPVPFLRARELDPGEDEAFVHPVRPERTAELYEHCCLAMDRSLTRGERGLPLFGTGDWNDGMNRVGREGRGESVWMGFFLFRLLGDFLPFCEARGDEARVRRYGNYRNALTLALEETGWDGSWYRRGYYDDGTPLGSSEAEECRIDVLVQAWAVLSGAASPERADRALEAAERHLVDEEAGIIRLLTPPFDRTPQDPGYIRGYVPGVRENGGQYTHAALWLVEALARRRRRDRAARLLDMLNPIHHARTPEEVAVYQVEPYVVAADVYGEPPHVGRGGWTWYTGSAGWMYRIALESILGFRIVGGDWILLDPCIPDGWPGFSLAYRIPGESTTYDIRVSNPHGRATSVAEARLDGQPAEVKEGTARVPLRHDGVRHRIDIVLG